MFKINHALDCINYNVADVFRYSDGSYTVNITYLYVLESGVNLNYGNFLLNFLFILNQKPGNSRKLHYSFGNEIG